MKKQHATVQEDKDEDLNAPVHESARPTCFCCKKPIPQGVVGIYCLPCCEHDERDCVPGPLRESARPTEPRTCFRVNKCKQGRDHTGPCDDWVAPETEEPR